MWIIEKKEGVVYDKITRILKTKKGEEIASVYVNKKGNLEISLMMDTNFLSDEGWGAVGFNGCENHIASSVWLENGGGTLEYQEDRHSIFSEPGEKINIKIMMLEGYIVFPLYRKVTTRSFFSDLRIQIKDLFGLIVEQIKKSCLS